MGTVYLIDRLEYASLEIYLSMTRCVGGAQAAVPYYCQAPMRIRLHRKVSDVTYMAVVGTTIIPSWHDTPISVGKPCTVPLSGFSAWMVGW